MKALRLAAGVVTLVVAASPGPGASAQNTLATLHRDIEAGTYGNVDHLYVLRGADVVADHRYARDYREISRGKVSPIGCGEGCADQSAMHHFNYLHPNWHPHFQGRPVHTLQSVTKSVSATLIGVALARREIPSLDRPLVDYFKNYNLTRVDARLRKATLADLLTMRSGIEWHEQDRPLDATNTTIQLERSRDWIQFTLDQPMDADPGTKWAYNSGGSQLMSGVIRTATGQFIDDYARSHLFAPLGIKDFHWKRTPTDHPDTEGGLYLTAEDLAKIGRLYLGDGVWNGRRILPEGFVAQATTRHAQSVAAGWDYGYQWWLTRRGGADVWAGRGFGGQLLVVVPSRNIVAVVLAWNVFGTPARNVFGPLVDSLLSPN